MPGPSNTSELWRESSNWRTQRSLNPSTLEITSAHSQILAGKITERFGTSPQRETLDLAEPQGPSLSVRNGETQASSVQNLPAAPSAPNQFPAATRFSRWDCKAGTLFYGWVCHAMTPEPTQLVDSKVIQLRKGEHVFAKERPLVVLEAFNDHFVVLPVCSHQGQGLINKAVPEEFVSLKDHRFPERCKQQSKHQPVVTESLEDYVLPLDPCSCIHITYPISMVYTMPIVILGRLPNTSTSRLQFLLRHYLPVGMNQDFGPHARSQPLPSSAEATPPVTPKAKRPANPFSALEEEDEGASSNGSTDRDPSQAETSAKDQLEELEQGNDNGWTTVESVDGRSRQVPGLNRRNMSRRNVPRRKGAKTEPSKS